MRHRHRQGNSGRLSVLLRRLKFDACGVFVDMTIDIASRKAFGMSTDQPLEAQTGRLLDNNLRHRRLWQGIWIRPILTTISTRQYNSSTL
jgi:hypothetical protein